MFLQPSGGRYCTRAYIGKQIIGSRQPGNHAKYMPEYGARHCMMLGVVVISALGGQYENYWNFPLHQNLRVIQYLYVQI